uniref:Uncharacterized protein n=1 Tax=Kryptolebias marmoratus TaxID=37003 RepID=A0A3Q3A4U4_KRYMA
MCTTVMVLATIALILRQRFNNKIQPYWLQLSGAKGEFLKDCLCFTIYYHKICEIYTLSALSYLYLT